MAEKVNKKWYMYRSLWVGALMVAVSVFTAIDAGVSWPQVVLAGLGTASIVLGQMKKLPFSK